MPRDYNDFEGAIISASLPLLTAAIKGARGGAHIADIGSGSLAGEMALLARAHRNSTARATTDIVVLHIDCRSLMAVLEDAPQIAVKMLPVVAARVTVTSDHHSHLTNGENESWPASAVGLPRDAAAAAVTAFGLSTGPDDAQRASRAHSMLVTIGENRAR